MELLSIETGLVVIIILHCKIFLWQTQVENKHYSTLMWVNLISYSTCQISQINVITEGTLEPYHLLLVLSTSPTILFFV